MKGGKKSGNDIIKNNFKEIDKELIKKIKEDNKNTNYIVLSFMVQINKDIENNQNKNITETMQLFSEEVIKKITTKSIN